MKKLIIIRGISGSGKSFLAKSIAEKYSCYIILSTDDFFIKNNEYKFDHNYLGAAHNWNYARCCKAVFDGIENIIIDNTNTQFWEFEKYCKIGLQNNYEIEVVEPDTPWKYDVEELTKRNTHGVPKETIQKMLDRMESTDIIMAAILELQGNK
jgi:NEDD4-binding protein 2